ncbi:MAG: OmpA family protein [Bacteroidota bacterium]|nr:OmpA family protein [Bacteroidota bacterium]
MKRIIPFLSLFFILNYSNYSFGQTDIVWANKLLELTDMYQFENNNAEMVLGPPTIYPSTKLDDKHDPYSEGYIVHKSNTRKKNIIKVGFSRPVSAKQLVLGGIFNIGTIYSLSVITPDDNEKVVYTLDQKPSLSKFTTFSVFFPFTQVSAVKIVLDHTNISDWNMLRGIGVTALDRAIDFKNPDMVEGAMEIQKKEKIGENISSKDCYEFNPKLTPDGKTLYFVKECPDQKTNDQEIWYSQLNEKNEWSDAKNAGGPLNNSGHNFVASISLDGKFMILGNAYNPDGSDAGEGVSIVYKKSDGSWDIPQPIKIPGYQNTNDHANFFMSSDEQVLLMALQDGKSYGDLDLYVSFYDKYKKSWSNPINLGQNINTPFSEDYPYLAPDNKTLYFSSKGYLGYGGHDIYMSKRLDDSWRRWSKPVNLGPMVNSKADDKGFTITSSGDKAYYNTVNFDSDLHHMDIYKVNLPKILHQNPQVLVSGYLFDAENKTTLRGTIRVKANNGDLVAFCVSSPKNGFYAMSVPFGQVYDVQVDALNYFQHNDKLKLADTTVGVDVMQNYILSHYLDSGQTLVLKDILFEANSAKLKNEATTELDKIVDILIQQPGSNIEISGHTDNVGKLEVNKKLSLDRARAVGAYFVSKGIREVRLSYSGYGSSKPIADNSKPEGRAQNRRVVVTFLSKLVQE